MSRGKYRSVNCTYYRRDEGIRLICEGATESMLSTNQVFPDRKALLEHRGKFCVKCPDGCPHKWMLDTVKYGLR